MALFAIAIMAVAALPTAHALYGNKNLWITPFKTGSCQNCPAVVLPWCIKVPAQNIVCPVPTHYGIASADVPLPSCLTFKADQLDGQVPAQQIQGPIPGSMIAGALGDSVTATPDRLQCDAGQATELNPCITVTPETIFPDDQLPDGVSVPASSISGFYDVGELSCSETTSDLAPCVQIDGATQLDGQLQATQITCDGVEGTVPLPSCLTVSGSQIVGSINATQVTGTLSTNATISGNQIQGSTISNTTFNGTIGTNAESSIDDCLPFVEIPKNTSISCVPDVTPGFQAYKCQVSCPAGYEVFLGCPIVSDGSTHPFNGCLPVATPNSSTCTWGYISGSLPCWNSTMYTTGDIMCAPTSFVNSFNTTS